MRASGSGPCLRVPRAGFLALILALLMLAAATAADARGVDGRHQIVRVPRTEVVPPNHERVVFIDYGKPGKPRKPEATADATDFRLLPGHPSWLASRSPISYSISTVGCSDECGGAASSVKAAFDAWEVSGLAFDQVGAKQADANPCGGTDSVSWAPIDGPGRILAYTEVCSTRGPDKQIDGFQTVFDSGDTWSDSGAEEKFDIQATATHEEGHTIGLDHVSAPRDARLTMYPFITAGDIGFRTLGCGDRLGVNALYGTTLDCSSVPLD